MAVYDINGDEITTDVVVDDTLTQSGQAADAKKVGDELAQLNDGDEWRY